MKKIILIITFAIFSLSAQAAQDNIIAKVGKKIITIDDINKRLAMVMIVNNLPQNQDIAQEIAPKVLNMLIDEELFFIEAEKLKITITDNEWTKTIEGIEKQNNLPQGKFLEALAAKNIDVKTAKRQINAQILWNKIVQQHIQPTIRINEQDVDLIIDNKLLDMPKNQAIETIFNKRLSLKAQRYLNKIKRSTVIEITKNTN
jgi:hypothetical protein